jgi:hypothetical protein
MTHFIRLCITALTFSVGAQLVDVRPELTLKTLYGTITITEPVLIECIQSAPFQRLKDLRQYGVMCHARENEPEYTRYQHSLGVYFIAQKYGAPLEEQLAALWHDASHTAFSHVGDRLFKSNFLTGKCSYQDEIHEYYLNHVGITQILEKYGYAHACSAENKEHQTCLDQPLPGLCADRIEYNLAGGYIDGMIDRAGVDFVLEHLHYENREWFFDCVEAARRFGLISIKLSETRWGAPWSAFIDHSGADALKRACELKIITYDDVHYSTDDLVWNKLAASDDTEIKEALHRITHYRDHFKPTESGTFHLRGKFSGTDPLVKTEEGLVRLSTLDAEYKAEYDRVKAWVTKGAWITPESAAEKPLEA